MKPIAMLCAALLLTGCAAVNTPLNQPLPEGRNQPLADTAMTGPKDGEVYIGLAFSGGGMRASAFSYGLLEELRAQTATAKDPDGVLSDVRLVTGVSGGSVTAAYFGLKGPKALTGYRENYLLTNAEKYMANSPLNPMMLVRGVSGGANGRKTFGRYLDETLFHGATFGPVAVWCRSFDSVMCSKGDAS